MSKRSTHKVSQRVKDGVESKRRVQLHVMRTQAEKISDMVGARVRELIADEVKNELDRRGYTEKPGHHDVEDLYIGEEYRADGGQATEVPQEPDGQPSSETPEPVEEAVTRFHCKACGFLGTDLGRHEGCPHYAEVIRQ